MTFDGLTDASKEWTQDTDVLRASGQVELAFSLTDVAADTTWTYWVEFEGINTDVYVSQLGGTNAGADSKVTSTK